MLRYLLLATAAALGFMFSGCESQVEQVRDAQQELRNAREDLREKQIKQRDAAVDAALEKEDNVNAARGEVLEKEHELRKEVQDLKKNP